MQSLAAFFPMHAVLGAVMRVDVLVAGVPCVVSFVVAKMRQALLDASLVVPYLPLAHELHFEHLEAPVSTTNCPVGHL